MLEFWVTFRRSAPIVSKFSFAMSRIVQAFGRSGHENGHHGETPDGALRHSIPAASPAIR
jgi:hypothetical protein